MRWWPRPRWSTAGLSLSSCGRGGGGGGAGRLSRWSGSHRGSGNRPSSSCAVFVEVHTPLGVRGVEVLACIVERYRGRSVAACVRVCMVPFSGCVPNLTRAMLAGYCSRVEVRMSSVRCPSRCSPSGRPLPRRGSSSLRCCGVVWVVELAGWSRSGAGVSSSWQGSRWCGSRCVELAGWLPSASGVIDAGTLACRRVRGVVAAPGVELECAG